MTFQSQRSPGAVERAAVTICRQHSAHTVGFQAAQGYQFPLNSQPSLMIVRAQAAGLDDAAEPSAIVCGRRRSRTP